MTAFAVSRTVLIFASQCGIGTMRWDSCTVGTLENETCEMLIRGGEERLEKSQGVRAGLSRNLSGSALLDVTICLIENYV